MELESILARVAQLEKDVAEARAKIFFLEALNVEQSRRQEVVRQPEHFIPSIDQEYEQFIARRESAEPERKLSPFGFDRIGGYPPAQKAVDEGVQVDKLSEEMFDGDY